MLRGIDISHWQANNYKSLIDNYAHDFCIFRAAFDKHVDSTCDPAYQYAKSKNKKLGVYFFPLNKKSSAISHAQWSYEQVKGYINEAIIFLDYEDYRHNGNVYNDARNVTWALEWLKEFERISGHKPVIYMNTANENACDWSPIVNNGNGLWIANYGCNDGHNHGYGNLRNWRLVALHQFTSMNGGISLDGDIFFGDKTAWSKYAHAKHEEQSKPVEQTKPSEQNKHVEQNNCSDESPAWVKKFVHALADFLKGFFK